MADIAGLVVADRAARGRRALRPRLRTFRDEAGRELFDVEDGRFVDPELPAPIRFLPQYDNIFLSHDDRSRILVEKVTVPDLVWKGGVLIDGFISAAWRIRREKAPRRR